MPSIEGVPVSTDLPRAADAVVVGGGTVGAWCAYFLRKAGLSRVVLLEKGQLGQGASSRAAGVVRLQGGTPEAVRLGRWSREFYLRQRAEIGTDSGFTQQGYLLPCFTLAEVAAAHERIAMQQELGIPVRFAGPDEVDALNPTLAPGATLGASYCADDGYMSNPDEPLGEIRSVDWAYMTLMRQRLAKLVPLSAGLGLRRIWAATIDYTPDHLPIIGPAPGLDRVFVASPGGAGMMWGPAVAAVTADVALTGSSEIADVSMLGLDRFDESGHSRLAADPIALPFPEKT